jgi:hypothetical protein
MLGSFGLLCFLGSWVAKKRLSDYSCADIREWNKIKLGNVCTKFVVRNGLFTIPCVIYFQAVKIGDDLMCVYNVGMFGFREGFGYLECVTVCQFVNSLFRSLGSVELGFVAEENLDYEEIEL